MNMIRHDYITTNGDVEVMLSTLGISDKRRVDFIAREIWFPQVGAKGDKIARARFKETTETWRSACEILLHAKTCSHGPAGRPMTSNSRLLDRPQAGGYNFREIAYGFIRRFLPSENRFQWKVWVQMVGSQPISIEER
jgi:hypothetical protein